ncbi:deacylase [Pelagibius sp.]|uniref:deacylase n=1 Tax=Pelagibius sp. TaxID=1931238 RepID=UPI003BB13D98
MSSISRVWTASDLCAPGKSADVLRIPYSTTRSAYGCLPIPFINVRGGDGPCAVFFAGNHGDEYEGQVVLRELAQELEPEKLRGQVLLFPSLNFSAVHNGSRVSPLDGGNLNRLFPGNPDGTPAEMLAHYIAAEILPMADVVIDLHSGGRSLDFWPCAVARYGDGHTDIEKRNVELLRAFGAPISYLTTGKAGGAGTTLAAAAQSLGIPAIMTELGGAAVIRQEGLRIARRGVRQVLAAFDIIDLPADNVSSSTQFIRMDSRRDTIYAPVAGLFEPLVEPGDDVAAGQTIGRLHDIDDCLRTPMEVTAPCPGWLACLRSDTSANHSLH